LADFDVLIAGAGPAGCAGAISLADFAPGLSVCLVDAPQGFRIGETVPPQIRPILEHLGLWRSFEADRHAASYRTVSAWGNPDLLSNEFLFQTQQIGWRLDRARFDAMMLQAAVARGARHLVAKVVEAAFVDDAWRIVLATGAPVTARFAIDATGRAAALARSQGLRPVSFDRLVGCFVAFEGAPDDGEGLMIETCPDGWWYSAAIPDGRRVIACMRDADLIRDVRRLDRWMQALGETHHVRLTVSGARPVGAPKPVPAGSRHLTGDGPLALISVGDAASCFDPVSGQGIIKALRSGIFASYAAADYLCRNEERGITRYRALVEREFSAYRRTLRDYYALEQRWPDRPFWRRRHGDDGRPSEAPLSTPLPVAAV
jgi:flavin-dependent dehydrogenase